MAWLENAPVRPPPSRRPETKAGGCAPAISVNRRRPVGIPSGTLLWAAAASGSAADAETLDQLAVARLVPALDVVEQRTALRNHLQEAATGMVVLAVRLEMLGEVGDALGEDRDL